MAQFSTVELTLNPADVLVVPASATGIVGQSPSGTFHLTNPGENPRSDYTRAFGKPFELTHLRNFNVMEVSISN